MQPNNTQPNQPSVPPRPPEQPQAPVPPVVQPPVPSPQPAPSQWNQPPSQPNFYGTSSYQQASPPPVQSPPPPEPIEGPLVMTLPLWLKDHWKLLVLIAIGGILAIIIALQLIYPSNRLLPGTTVDGVSLGWMRKDDAVKKLNEAYGNLKLGIYFGSNQAAFQTPKYKDVGIGVNTASYLEPYEYPWYLRLIPTSFFWSAGFSKPGELLYAYDKGKIDSYIQSQVGDDCTIPARDASLKLVDDKLQLVPSRPGGVCDITRFQQVLATTQPSAKGENKVTIDIRETAALVDDDKARLLAGILNDRTSTPMPITVGGGSQTIAGKTVLSWLDFKSFIPETPAGQPRDEDRVRSGAKLTFTVNHERMNTLMANGIAKQLIVKPGVNKVSTRDFTVVSRVDGQVGRELDRGGTAATVENYLNKKAERAIAQTRPVAPSTSYTRSYSPTSTGFRAMLTQWPEEHPGNYAMSFQELSGPQPYRKAHFNGTQPMLGAGLEAGYVGYAVALGQQNSSILDTDSIAGRTPNECFKDMIEKTDTDCITGFMRKIGNETMVARGKELGLKGTTFSVSDTKTTTEDMLSFLTTVYRTQLAPTAGGGRVLASMQSIRLNDGVEAGIDKGNVANIAGESGTIHNDGAIVYSPKGAYILVVMSDGASRQAIAELARKIEALHQVAPVKPDS